MRALVIAKNASNNLACHLVQCESVQMLLHDERSRLFAILHSHYSLRWSNANADPSCKCVGVVHWLRWFGHCILLAGGILLEMEFSEWCHDHSDDKSIWRCMLVQILIHSAFITRAGCLLHHHSICVVGLWFHKECSSTIQQMVTHGNESSNSSFIASTQLHISHCRCLLVHQIF